MVSSQLELANYSSGPFGIYGDAQYSAVALRGTLRAATGSSAFKCGLAFADTRSYRHN